MSRRHFTFACEGALLAATLDEAPGETGLLIVSGGNETRAGTWNGQALLAADIAAAGYPVLRFDRRGVGDSEGSNSGFRGSAPDIAAALAEFRAQCPQLARVVALGNCDAASALMLGGGAGCDALVLCNPWSFDEESSAGAAPPPAALRAHYRQRLTDFGAIRRLLTGKVSLRGLLGSLRGVAAPPPPPSGLTAEMRAGLAGFSGPAIILLAGRDRTALSFAAAWGRADPRIRHCRHATHSFVEAEAREWLEQQVLAALAG